MKVTLLDAALKLAKTGLNIPAHTIRNGCCTCSETKHCSPGKHPVAQLVKRGFINATDDADVIREWWSNMPDANIGIATGKPSGLVVLDVDGPLGEQTLAKLEQEHGALPPTLEVKTGKGRHLYFRYPDNETKIKSVARSKNKLDVRGDGGYCHRAPVSP